MHRVLRARLEKQWEGLAPAVQDLLKQVGVGGRAASLDDFLWAYSIFWCVQAMHPTS